MDNVIELPQLINFFMGREISVERQDSVCDLCYAD